MSEILSEILEVIGGVSILILIVGFLSKKLINHLFRKDLAKFKSDLEKENQKFKSDLENEHQKQLIELKVRTENMFHEYKENIKHLSEERIKAVKEVHNKLIEVHAAYFQMISIMRTQSGEPFYVQREQDVDICCKKLNELLECAMQNEVYLPTSLSEKIFEWRKKLSTTCTVYGPIICDPSTETGENPELLRLWGERGIEENTFEDIRKELKKIIGVEN
jgi:hypothetical protein